MTEVAILSSGSGPARFTKLVSLVNPSTGVVGGGDASEATLSDAAASLDAIQAAVESTDPALVVMGQAEYETVAASQTAQVLGATGAIGDYLAGLLIVPATTAAGSVSILDNATSISVFVTGTLPSLIPFFIPLGIKSVSGAWKVTTGANVSVIAMGDFT